MQPQGPYSFQDGTGVYYRPPVQSTPANAKLYVITAPVFWDYDKGEAYAQGGEATASDTPEVPYDYSVLIDQPLAPTKANGEAWGDAIYIPTLSRQKQDGVDKATSGFPSGALYPGRRVWVAERNSRLELLSNVEHDDWIIVSVSMTAVLKPFSVVDYNEWPCFLYDDSELPYTHLYGFVYASTNQDVYGVPVNYNFGITGPWEADADSYSHTPGKANWSILSPARSQPRLCRFAWGPNNPQELPNTTWGPCPGGGGKMWPGLPGFILAPGAWYDNAVIQLPDGDYATWFIRADKPAIHFAVVTESWVKDGDCSVHARPCVTDLAAHSYDGSHTFGDITLPLYNIYVYFPMLNPLGLPGKGRKYDRAREPNVAAGDIISYQFFPQRDTYLYPSHYRGPFFAMGDVYDDPIGTVKMWTGPTDSLPRGWKIMDGTQKTGGIDTRSKVPYGVGTLGNLTAGGTVGTFGVYFIERVS
jgi:hypothetical protein